MISKTRFGEPYLRKVKLVRKYELEGVAFVKDGEEPEKSVGFTFHSSCSENLSVKIEDADKAHDVYDFFGRLFGWSGMNKTMGWLFVEWNILDGNREAVLMNIEKNMDAKWKEAFRTIFSVYDK